MQACEGYVENGKFYSLKDIQIQGRRRAFLTILDESAPEKASDGKAFWMEFDRRARESADENHVFDDEAFARRPSGREPIDFSAV